MKIIFYSENVYFLFSCVRPDRVFSIFRNITVIVFVLCFACLTERRNARLLTIEFPLADERSDHLNLSKSSSKMNQKDLKQSHVLSTSVVRVAQGPAQNYTLHQFEAFEWTCDSVESYHRPQKCQVNVSDKDQFITQGVLFETQNSTSSTSTDEFHRS